MRSNIQGSSLTSLQELVYALCFALCRAAPLALLLDPGAQPFCAFSIVMRVADSLDDGSSDVDEEMLPTSEGSTGTTAGRPSIVRPAAADAASTPKLEVPKLEVALEL